MNGNTWLAIVDSAHVPTYFKALLIEAATQKRVLTLDGKSFLYTYATAGHQLGRNIDEYVTKEILDGLHSDNWHDPEIVEGWLKEHMNGFFRLVPPRRRGGFIKGFIEATDER